MMAMEYENTVRYECPKCDFKTDSWREMYDHRNEHSPENQATQEKGSI